MNGVRAVVYVGGIDHSSGREQEIARVTFTEHGSRWTLLAARFRPDGEWSPTWVSRLDERALPVPSGLVLALAVLEEIEQAPRQELAEVTP